MKDMPSSAPRSVAPPPQLPPQKKRYENEIFEALIAKPFAIASKFLRNAQFATFCLRFGGYNSLANCRGASEFAFAFAAVTVDRKLSHFKF